MDRKLGGLILALLPFCAFAQEAPESAADCSQPAWKIVRKADPMNDSGVCMVIRQNGDTTGSLGFILNPKLGPAFLVSGRKYPGRRQGIRVDSNEPIYFNELASRATADLILAQLRAGTKITTEFSPWPSGGVNYNTMPVCELVKLLDDCITSPTK